MPGTRASVDSASGPFVSFAPLHEPEPSTGSREPVAVGPGRSATVGTSPHRATVDPLNQFPIQPAKVQCPALREETLARGRLLDWLNASIHDRVILVLADAGYGKTTLLADFSRRTRLRTLWYRFEEDDRDWTAVLSHLVAAGREHDPTFAPTTAALLAEIAVGGPTRESVIETFLRELATVTEPGAVIILDDFHLVDESPDVRLIARELVAHAPERTTVIFSSRRPPSIGLARLRASGEVAELGTDDLRFDATETRQLFTETYGRALDQDVIDDVVKRTEGWAASLQLIQQALRDRSPSDIRRFIRGLSGADRELYDYLAEEVVGELPEDVQQFLMRTSILQSVTPKLASVVSGLDDQGVARLTATAERLTLLSRPPRAGQGPHRYHPLVREFLEARLLLNAGAEAVTQLHRQAAEAAVTMDWRIAAHHYREAGDADSVRSVLASALPEIMGNGQYTIAAEFAERVHDDATAPALALIRSRIELQRGDTTRSTELARAVLERSVQGTREHDHALLNLMASELMAGDAESTIAYAETLVASTQSPTLRSIGQGIRLLVDSSRGGSLDAFAEHVKVIANAEKEVHPHFYGVSLLNLAIVATLQDDLTKALEYADDAIEALEQTSSNVELSSALMAKATLMAMKGDGKGSTACADRARAYGPIEALIESADLADSYLDPEGASRLLDEIDARSGLSTNNSRLLAIISSRYLARRRRASEAQARLEATTRDDDATFTGQDAILSATAAYVSAAASLETTRDLAEIASRKAASQGATAVSRISRLVGASAGSARELSTAVTSVGSVAPWHVTFVADLIAPRLSDLDQDAVRLVWTSAQIHPGRWRYVLRNQLSGGEPNLAAAQLLEQIGDRGDVRRLRMYGRTLGRSAAATTLGKALARRSAERVYVDDLNRVAIHVGERLIPGTTVRRKVLSLLCLLLSKPGMSSARDQVLDALWPELDPPDALNSLNQTVYFLRRVFEEDFVEDLSPGYVHHDSDVIWLDPDLVRSRSNECRALIRALPPDPSPAEVEELVVTYEGRFALDFEYEEWAAPYRDWLHASFLGIVERAVARDLETGHHERGIALARRAIDVDPGAEQVEVSLLRLYRASGAHAAAAEQYGHYAQRVRSELDLEPPPLEAV